jgi:pilus assembly protein CpaF
VENPKLSFGQNGMVFGMEHLNQILSRTRNLARVQGLDLDSATQQAIDELSEAQTVPLDEIELAQRARLELEGLGVLQPLLDNPEIEEIWINRPNEVHYFGTSGRESITVDLSSSQIRTLCFRMLSHSRRRVDRLTPYVDASLADGSRLHIVIPEITGEHWAINIRKFNRPDISLEQLARAGSLSALQLDQLQKAMTEGKSVLVAGATQAGKTTLMSALLRASNPTDRIISCEDTFELALTHQDWVAMQTRPAAVEGAGEISLRELVKQALRMRPDRLVIGEVRGAEALDMLVALNSGIPGLCTLHANSARAALQKLLTLPLLAGENISDSFLRPTVVGAFDLVVFCRRDRLGHRRVEEVIEVSHEAIQ